MFNLSCAALCRITLPKRINSTFLDFIRSLTGTSSDPLKLVYSDLGGSNESPVIVQHGLFGSKNNWKSLSAVLNRTTGRRIITVDARNHGDSPHSSEISIEAMSKDMEFLAEDLNIKKCILVGHSLGGKTAAVTALTRPDLVEKLVVVDVSPQKLTPGYTPVVKYINAMKEVTFDPNLPLSQVRRETEKQLENVITDKPTLKFILTNLVDKKGIIQWKINVDSIYENIENIFDFPAITTQYLGPTLFLGGTLSQHIRESNYPEIKRLFPNAMIEHIKGAGHWVHVEKPKPFLDRVVSFITAMEAIDF